MAKILSPIRIARARRTSVTNVAETMELDFALGLEMGLHIHAVEFGLAGWTHTPVDDSIDFDNGYMSLHAESGALEGAIDAFPADDFILNSEIIAETSLQVQAFTSSVPATSPDVFNSLFLQPKKWDYHALFGGPLTIAQNLQFRAITSNSVMVMNGVQVTIYYQYVKLTESELAAQFTLRR